METRTALPGGRNRASCGPTAGRGDRRASPPRGTGVSSNRPAGSLHSQCKYAPPGLLSRKAAFHNLFCDKHLARTVKVLLLFLRSKRTPKESTQLENRDASRECSRQPPRGTPPSLPGRAQRRALLQGRASEEEYGPRRAVPALPAEARAGTETASAAAAASTQPSRNARSTWKKRPNCASRYLQRSPARPRSAETRRTEGRAHTRSKLEFRGE